MKLQQLKRTAFVCLLLITATIAFSGQALSAMLTWESAVYKATWFEEDIRVVLKDILQRNGKDVIFKPGIEGQVTIQFETTPLEGAFNKIISEYDLDYSYDDTTGFVTLFPRTKISQSIQFLTPEVLTASEIRTTLTNLGLMREVEMSVDQASGAILIKGDPKKVADIQDIVKNLDASKIRKREAALNYKLREKDERLKQLEIEQKEKDLAGGEIILEPEVKVIPLRYASVGESTTTFQGESVSIPGIIDSLRAFIGGVEDSKDTGKGSSKKQQTVISSGIGRPIVAVDRRTNSIIVQGTPGQIANIEDVVKRLDRPVDLVEIQVMILEGSDTLSKSLGVKWGVNGVTGKRGLLASTSSNTTPFATAASTADANLATSTTRSGVFSLLNSGGAAGGSASFLYRGTREVLDATISFLESNNMGQTVAAPRVVTLNNRQASVTNANNFNVKVAAANTGTGNTDGGIQTIQTGVTLEITPSILPAPEEGDETLLRLEVNATNSSPATGSTEGSETNEQQIQTSVIIPEATTFILGGLFTNTRSETETGIPFFKDIPILGALFRDRTSQDDKSETVFLITPTIHRQEGLQTSSQGKEIHDFVNHQHMKLKKGLRNLQKKSYWIDLNRNVEEDE